VPDQRQPNIVVIAFDALGTDAMHQHLSKFPALASLRDASTVFDNAYTPAPQGGPARASLFTGLDPSVHGVWTDGVALADLEQTFPQRLLRAGYYTWLVGRRHLSGMSHWTTEPLRAGEYTHCEWAHGPLHRSRQNAYLNWLQANAPDQYASIFQTQPDPDDTHIPRTQFEGINYLEDELSFNHWVGERLCQMIAVHTDDRPFLGVAGFVVGDAMGSEPDVQGERLNVTAAIQADKAVKQLINCLQDSAHADNTVIVACAGHGNCDSDLVAQPMSESRIRVPLSVYLPETSAAVVTQAVSTIDIAATVCDLAHLYVPQRLQGKTLLSVVAGDNNRLGWALCRQRCERGGWFTALRSENWKLVVSHGRHLKHGEEGQRNELPAYHLFDLAADPLEQYDLASGTKYTAILEQMIDTLIDARCALEDRTEPRIAKF